MRKLSIFIFFMSCFSLNTQAQVDIDVQGEMETKKEIFMNLNLLLTVPQRLYKERQPRVGFGWGGNIHFEIKKPLFLGIEGSWQRYDRERDVFTDFDELGPYEVQETTSSQILGINAFFRVKPELDFFIKPYVDGFIGYNFLYTRTVLKDIALDENFNSMINGSDWALNYGVAVGAQMNLSRELLFLDVRCAYLLGNNAEFYTRIEGADVPLSIANFELKTAPPTMIMPQIGITFILTSEKEEEL